jgi:hypothetical protein
VTDDARETIVAPAAQRARDVGGHRGIWIAGALAVLSILVLAGLMLLRSSTQQAQIDALTTSAAENHSAAQQLADQVRQLGGVPATQPPPMTGAQGPQGLQGLKGDKGDPGQPGKDGKDGQNPPCLSTPAQCQGANGIDGQPGTAGQDGANGAPGTKGDKGDKGDPGAQGPPGPTCPDGYSLGPAIVVSPDGSTHQGLACIQNPPPTTSSSSAQRIGR